MSDTTSEDSSASTIGDESLEQEESEIRETPPPEDPQQVWEDALALGLMARILTGRTEFEDSDKLKEMLTPEDNDTCSLINGSMMGDLFDALIAGNYNMSAEQALEDILTPMRYAAVCSHLNHNPGGIGGFFKRLFSGNKNKGEPANYSEAGASFVTKLLCFHYTTLAFNVPGITTSTLQQFEQGFGSQQPLNQIITVLPEDLQKVIRGCMSIPDDQINQDTIKKYFGGRVPFLLVFNKSALEKAMYLARQNGPSSVSDSTPGNDVSQGLIAYGDEEETESEEGGNNNGQVPVGLFDEKTAIKEFFGKRNNNSNTSGRVKYSMEIGSSDLSE